MATFLATLRILLDLLTGRLAKRLLAIERMNGTIVKSQNGLLSEHAALRRLTYRKLGALEAYDQKLTRDVVQLSLWRVEALEREKLDRETSEILQAFTLEEEDKAGEEISKE